MSISLTLGWHKMKVNPFLFMLAPWPSTSTYLAPILCFHFSTILPVCVCVSVCVIFTVVLHTCGMQSAHAFQIYQQPPCSAVSRSFLKWKCASMGCVSDTHISFSCFSHIFLVVCGALSRFSCFFSWLPYQHLFVLRFCLPLKPHCSCFIYEDASDTH